MFDATGEEYKPNCLVADAAGAITRGFQRAFSYESIHDYSRVVCWQHVKRASFQRLVSVTRELRESLRADLYALQASQSRNLFAMSSKLFLSKWNQEKSQTFINYFKKQWLDDKRSGWYQGYLPGIPDNNNNNESDNRWIKEGKA